MSTLGPLAREKGGENAQVEETQPLPPYPRTNPSSHRHEQKPELQKLCVSAGVKKVQSMSAAQGRDPLGVGHERVEVGAAEEVVDEMRVDEGRVDEARDEVDADADEEMLVVLTQAEAVLAKPERHPARERSESAPSSRSGASGGHTPCADAARAVPVGVRRDDVGALRAQGAGRDRRTRRARGGGGRSGRGGGEGRRRRELHVAGSGGRDGRDGRRCRRRYADRAIQDEAGPASCCRRKGVSAALVEGDEQVDARHPQVPAAQ